MLHYSEISENLIAFSSVLYSLAHTAFYYPQEFQSALLGKKIMAGQTKLPQTWQIDEFKKNQKVDFPFTLWPQNYPLLKKGNRGSTHIGPQYVSSEISFESISIYVNPFLFNYKKCG